MTKRTPSQSFIAEVTNRIQKLQQVSEESGLDLTKDLFKTLNQFSEISRNSPSLNYSQSSDMLDESFLILQPTNSVFSIPGDNFELVASIRQKNLELEKNCTEKLIELHSTTKEFCAITMNNVRGNTFVEETTVEKTAEAENKPQSIDLRGNRNDELVQEEIQMLRERLEKATLKINESQMEIEKQQKENQALQTQLQKIIESSNKSSPLPKLCDCLLF